MGDGEKKENGHKKQFGLFFIFFTYFFSPSQSCGTKKKTLSNSGSGCLLRARQDKTGDI